MKRWRSCSVDGACVGDYLEEMECNIKDCREWRKIITLYLNLFINIARWTNWGSWISDSRFGCEIRTRECYAGTVSVDCLGDQEEYQDCCEYLNIASGVCSNI